MSLRPRPGFRTERKPLFAEQSERTSEVTTIFPKRQNVRRIRKRPAAPPAQVPLRPPDGRPPRPFRKKDYMKPATFALSYNDLNCITDLHYPAKKAERPSDTFPKNRRSSDRTRTTVNNRPERPTSKPTISEKTRQRRPGSSLRRIRNSLETIPFGRFFPITGKRRLRKRIRRFRTGSVRATVFRAHAPRPIRQKDETDDFCARLRTSLAVRSPYTIHTIADVVPFPEKKLSPAPAGPDKNRGVRRLRHTPLFLSNQRSRYTDATPMIPFSDPPIKSSR